MRGPIRSVLLAALAVCAFAALVGQASAARLGTVANPSFQAIYGEPGVNGATLPVGGGLGRNFGFGENMLFEANATAPRAVLSITLETTPATTATAQDSFIGGTLMSNKTGANNPLSFDVQFVDFQNSKIGTALVPSYADTNDRPWIAEICSPEAAAHTCRPDPQAGVAAAGEGSNPGEVVIQDVSFDLQNVPTVGTVVVQGTVWGTWEGTKPPCIKLHLPPAAPAGVNRENLYVTQPVALIGTKVSAISGTACLLSANNDWFSGTEPATTLKNE